MFFFFLLHHYCVDFNQSNFFLSFYVMSNNGCYKCRKKWLRFHGVFTSRKVLMNRKDSFYLFFHFKARTTDRLLRAAIKCFNKCGTPYYSSVQVIDGPLFSLLRQVFLFFLALSLSRTLHRCVTLISPELFLWYLKDVRNFTDVCFTGDKFLLAVWEWYLLAQGKDCLPLYVSRRLNLAVI